MPVNRVTGRPPPPEQIRANAMEARLTDHEAALGQLVAALAASAAPPITPDQAKSIHHMLMGGHRHPKREAS